MGNYERLDYQLRWDKENFQWCRYVITKDKKKLIKNTREVVKYVDLKDYPNSEQTKRTWMEFSSERKQKRKNDSERIYSERMSADFEWSANYRAIHIGLCSECGNDIKVDGEDPLMQYPIYLRSTKGHSHICEVCANKLSSNIIIHGIKPPRDSKTLRPMGKQERERLLIDQSLKAFGFETRKRIQ